MNIPGFTAEAALSMNSRNYRVLPPMGRQLGVQPAISIGGGGIGGTSNFRCGTPDAPDECSCLGGILSSDCSGMPSYCSGPLQCSPYNPYKCTCPYGLKGPASGGNSISTIT